MAAASGFAASGRRGGGGLLFLGWWRESFCLGAWLPPIVFSTSCEWTGLPALLALMKLCGIQARRLRVRRPSGNGLNSACGLTERNYTVGRIEIVGACASRGAPGRAGASPGGYVREFVVCSASEPRGAGRGDRDVVMRARDVGGRRGLRLLEAGRER
jgi:hypothetical protein